MKQSFIVARIYAPYNAIFSRTLLNELSVVMTPRYLLMKFEIDKGIAFVKGDGKDNDEEARGANFGNSKGVG